MKAFNKYALSAYLMLTATLACNAEVNLFGTANKVSTDDTVVAKETADDNASVEATEDEVAASEAKKAIQKAQKNQMVNKFLFEIKQMADEIEKANSKEDVWYWSNSNNLYTFEQQKASGHMVCNDALLICWSLHKCGIFSGNDMFYLSNGNVMNNGGDPEVDISQYFDAIRVSGKAQDLLDEGKIMVGDIVGYDYTHTNVYAGNGLWYDASPLSCDVRNSNGNAYFVSVLSKKGAGDHNVTCVYRFKNSESTEKKSRAEQNAESNVTGNTTNYENYTGPYKQDKKSFLACLKKMSEQCASDYQAGRAWMYSNEGVDVLYQNALNTGNRQTNCAQVVDWALVEIGVMGAEQFYTDNSGEIVWRGPQTKQHVEQYCDIIPVRRKMGDMINDGTLQAGDICCYNFCHTNVYAGNHTWYDGGRRPDSTYVVNGNNYFKSFFSTAPDLNWQVNYIIRLRK